MTEHFTSGEEPTEQTIFDEVHRLMMLELMAERESREEAFESGASSRFKDEENNALSYLLGHNPEAVAEAYIYLMSRYIEREVERGEN